MRVSSVGPVFETDVLAGLLAKPLSYGAAPHHTDAESDENKKVCVAREQHKKPKTRYATWTTPNAWAQAPEDA